MGAQTPDMGAQALYGAGMGARTPYEAGMVRRRHMRRVWRADVV